MIKITIHLNTDSQSFEAENIVDIAFCHFAILR